jgi:hypothetical protein
MNNLKDIQPGQYNNYIIQESFHDSANIALPDGEGQYFATVIAYNHALSPSKPVCSVHKNENISEVFVLVSNISGRTPKISSFVSFLHLCKQASPPSFLLETSSPINHDFSSKHRST